MQRPEELERLLADLESELVERKPHYEGEMRDRVCQAVCAYANDLPSHGVPGVVFVGVDDGGNPTGLPITERMLNALADIRSNGNILPQPQLSVCKVQLRGRDIAVIEVQPSNWPPVRYRQQTWIRVGARRGLATAAEERHLAERQRASILTFDQRPCQGAERADLVLGLFRDEYLPRAVAPEAVAQNGRSSEEQLASLRFLDLREGVSTYAGILLFGEDPLRFLPGAYLQFVRFGGEALHDPIEDQREIAGNLPTQLRQLDALLPAQIRTARVAGPGLAHRDVPDYPLSALRELVVNALTHRDYESPAPTRLNWFRDRVEIQSPGGLYGVVTPENFRRVSDYRNPIVAVALKVLGYVERFGVGIARAEAALRENGSPEAEFEIERSHFLVRIRRRP